MNSQSISPSLADKAWSLLRRADLRALWCAARRRITDREAWVVERWYKNGAENTLRFHYPLTGESIVFDVGGYRGKFTREIVSRYDAHVYVFEPIPEFHDELVKEFHTNPKVKICGYGLSRADSISQMMFSEEGSTVYMTGGMQIAVRLRDIWTVIQELGIIRIDLIKINIEGGEYVLLHRMLETGLVPICQDIQVQFHRFYPGSKRLRSEIRGALEKTHFLTYDYPFVWENWRKKVNRPCAS
jgi:FkbM family methyltransferase